MTMTHLMSFHIEDNVVAFGLVGGCDAVVAALVGFPADRELQLHGMRAISRLSQNITNAQKLGMVGACERVVSCLSSFQTDPDLQLKEVRAVADLAADTENARHLNSSGVADMIRDALKSYSSCSNFQRYGNRALEVLGGSRQQDQELLLNSSIGDLSFKGPEGEQGSDCVQLGEHGGMGIGQAEKQKKEEIMVVGVAYKSHEEKTKEQEEGRTGCQEGGGMEEAAVSYYPNKRKGLPPVYWEDLRRFVKRTTSDTDEQVTRLCELAWCSLRVR